jgi:hypothetical protein
MLICYHISNHEHIFLLYTGIQIVASNPNPAQKEEKYVAMYTGL